MESNSPAIELFFIFHFMVADVVNGSTRVLGPESQECGEEYNHAYCTSIRYGTAVNLELLTLNGGELESSPQDKLGSGTSSPTQLQTGSLPKNFEHVEGQAKVLVGFASTGNFNDDSHAVVSFSEEEVDSHVGRVVECSIRKR
jgi:hypothetical protein